MPFHEDKLREWWDQSNTKNILLPAAQSAMPYLPGGMLSNMVEAEGTNLVNLLGGQQTPAQAYEHSPIMQGFVEPLRDFGSMVGQALKDPRSLWDVDQETGEVHIGQEPIEAAAGAAMTIPMAGLASGAERSLLSSGPKFEPHPTSAGWMKAHPDYEPPGGWNWEANQAAPDYGFSPDEPNIAGAYDYLDDAEIAHLKQAGVTDEALAGWDWEDAQAALDNSGYYLKTGAYGPTDFQPFAHQYAPPAKIYSGTEDGLKMLNDGSFITPDELNHLKNTGLSDEQISSMSTDEAELALDNSGYYPDPLADENWTPHQLPEPPSQVYVPASSGPHYDALTKKLQSFYGLDEKAAVNTADHILKNPKMWPNDPGLKPYIDAADEDAAFGKLQGFIKQAGELNPNQSSLPTHQYTPDHPLAQKPYYGTGSQETDDLIEKASANGWNPYTLAGKYTAGELDDTDLTFHSLTHASTTSGPVYDHLKKGYTGPMYSGAGSDPLAVKPLQPWAAPNPAIDFSTGKYIDPNPPPADFPLKKHDEDWQAIFAGLYESGANENELIKRFLGNQGGGRGDPLIGRAAAEELLAMKPEDRFDFHGGHFYDPVTDEHTRSLIVPHGFYARSPDWKDKVNEFMAKGFPGDMATEQRAIDLGFDPDPKKYKWHASDYAALRFLDPVTKPRSRAAFLAETPEVAREYGKYLYPIMPRIENPLVKDWGGLRVDHNEMMRRFLEEANAGGYESAIGLNIKDIGPGAGGSVEHQTMLMKPHLARSPWAKFNLARKNDPDWLAGGGLPFNPFDFLAQTEEQRRRNAY